MERQDLGSRPASGQRVPQPSPAKNWCFTWNSPTEGKSAKELVQEIAQNFDTQYVIGGLETAPSTGQKHLQGFLILKTKKRLTALKKIDPLKGAHWEVARGSPSENKTYCSKEGRFHEEGEMPETAERGRADIKEIRKMVNEGKNMAEILQVATSYQSAKMAQLMIEHRAPPKRANAPTVVWCHGETGSGKSRWAHSLHPDAYLAPGTKWFQGYVGQKVAIFDDFRASDMPFNMLLKVLDRYPLQLETKGGFTHWYPEKIIITTPLSPEYTYGAIPQEDMRQLLRRITEVKAFPMSADEALAVAEAERQVQVLSDPVDPEVRSTVGEGNTGLPRLHSDSAPLNSQDSVFEADTQPVYVDDNGEMRPLEVGPGGGYLVGSPTNSEMDYMEDLAAMRQDAEAAAKRRKIAHWVDLTAEDSGEEPKSSPSSGKTNSQVEETSSMEADGSDFELF